MVQSLGKKSSLIEFFDRAYVINLPHRTDRRAAIERELERIQVFLPSNQAVIFPGVRPTEPGPFPSIGARGCFLSHLSILKDARNRGCKSVLIIEDDLCFPNSFTEKQRSAITQLSNREWDIVYLGHGEPTITTAPITFQPIFHHLQTTHFLGFNGRILDRLINFLEVMLERPAGHPLGGPMHVDGAYNTFREQNPDVITLLANPTLGFQRSSRSDIEGQKWFDDVPVLGQLVATGRTFRTWYRKRSLV